MAKGWTRREVLGALGTGILGLSPGFARDRHGDGTGPAPYKVGIIACATYEDAALMKALQVGWFSTHPPDVRGKSVVIKPNIADFSPDRPIHTNARLVRALALLIKGQGARQVIIAEGTPQNRDSELIFAQSGYSGVARDLNVPLIDLNYDNLRSVHNPNARSRLLKDLALPETILAADMVISVAKMKTHKLAGITLCLKNMFGIVPGIKYGWPKNVLHWNGIPSSICEINTTVTPRYAIVDGILGMEGHGPIMGTAKNVGVLVMGDNALAVDATAARIMGVDPARVDYLAMAQMVGLGSHRRNFIDLVGEDVLLVRKDFRLIPDFSHLRASPG